ncbi:MAG TPA: hypothetical protein VNU94_07610 [Acidobacteriaceae bacterium]|jgi:hypothetical protein|nr:hypothetical protein [Acidobacteriaceae bacterium]
MPKLDLESVQDLVRAADIEGFIADGDPADEYDPEERYLFAALASWPSSQFTKANVLPVIVEIWRKSFSLDDADLSERLSRIDELTAQIVHFFGAHND